MKKIYLFSLLLITLYSSCDSNSSKIENKEIIKKAKYEFRLLEMDDETTFMFVVDKTEGRVFISKNNSNWYEATHEVALPKMNFDCYTIEVKKEITPKGTVPKVILFNQVTSEMYIYVVDNVANFYSAMSPFDNIQQ